MLADYIGKGMKNVLSININDTDFKINSIVKDSDIKASDSLIILQNYFDENQIKKINQFKTTLKPHQETLEKYEKELKVEKFRTVRKMLSKYIEEEKLEIKRMVLLRI